MPTPYSLPARGRLHTTANPVRDGRRTENPGGRTAGEYTASDPTNHIVRTRPSQLPKC